MKKGSWLDRHIFSESCMLCPLFFTNLRPVKLQLLWSAQAVRIHVNFGKKNFKIGLNGSILADICATTAQLLLLVIVVKFFELGH